MQAIVLARKVLSDLQELGITIGKARGQDELGMHVPKLGVCFDLSLGECGCAAAPNAMLWMTGTARIAEVVDRVGVGWF